MISLHRLGSCLFAVGFTTLLPACGGGQDGATNVATSHLFRATETFRPVEEPGLVPPYLEKRAQDPDEHGMAVNTRKYGGTPAAAEITFPGPAGTYDLILTAVGEEDGESLYAIAINAVTLTERQNPPGSEKRRPVHHTWSQVSLAPGDQIRVIFRGHSNGRIPEGDGFAWSRGRWRSLLLTRSKVQNSEVTAPLPHPR